MSRPRALVVLLAAALFLGPPSSDAEVYRWIDSHGVVTYSDHPPSPGDANQPPLTTEPEKPVAPVVAEPTGPVTVDDILELSGLKRQLAGLTSHMEEQFRPQQGQMNARDRATVAHIVSRAFAPERLYPLIKAEFSRQVDQAKLAAVAAWLRSPLGRKITALEVASSEPEGQRQLTAYVAGLQQNPPSADRVTLVQRMDWVSGDTDASVEILMAALRSLSRTVQSALPPGRRVKPGQIENQIEQARAQTVEPVRRAILVTMLFTYRSLADDEFREYLKFLGSDAGRWFNAVTKKSLIHAVRGASDRTAVELVRAVPLERWRAAEPGKATAQ